MGGVGFMGNHPILTAGLEPAPPAAAAAAVALPLCYVRLCSSIVGADARMWILYPIGYNKLCFCAEPAALYPMGYNQP